jgi:hypothetical protein
LFKQFKSSCDIHRSYLLKKKIMHISQFYVEEGIMPQYFVIHRDPNNLLWQKYIEWLNTTYIQQFDGSALWYGFDGSSSYTSMVSLSLESFDNDPLELTLEQWDQIINKQTMSEKKLMGYKLKEDCKQYKKAALNICNAPNTWGNNLEQFDIFIGQSGYINALKKAEVFSLWFEPIYEDIFKINNWVTDDDINIYQIGNKIGNYYYPKAGKYTDDMTNINTSLSFGKGLRHATKEEILNHLQKEFTDRTGITIGSHVEVINSISEGVYSDNTSTWYLTNSFLSSIRIVRKFKLSNKNTLLINESGSISYIWVSSEAVKLETPKLPFGGDKVILKKTTSGIRIICNGEVGTLNQLEKIYDYITNTTLKFGQQPIDSFQFYGRNIYLGHIPSYINIGCITGTWREFMNVLEEARKLNEC